MKNMPFVHYGILNALYYKGNDKKFMTINKKYIPYVYADTCQDDGHIPYDKRPACIFSENYRRNILLKKENK